MGSVRDDFATDITDFAEFVHKIDTVMQAAGGIDNRNIGTACYRSAHRVESDGRRIGAH